MSGVNVEQKSYEMPPKEGISIAHFLTVKDIYPDFALQTAGGDVSVAAPWKGYVLQDRELISGQNPFSDEALLMLLLPAPNTRRAAA